MDYYLYAKSLHIIFITTWFAGLFYIVRLFIYFKEAEENKSSGQDILQKQYRIMIKRLWYMITWPSAILATIFAVWLILINPVLIHMGWMQLKLFFVLLLYVYHSYCQHFYNQSQKGDLKVSSYFLRIWNEVATVILFACVFLVVLKNMLGWVFGTVGIVVLSILLMLGIKWYKMLRDKKK
jgi:putative membrane protein